jgi:multimeric flavodoxin WrbA
MTCKTLDECVLKDDLTEVFAAIREADVLVMASPVHFGEVAYQLKAFIERTYCFVKPDFLINPQPSRLRPGKKLVFILTQEEPDESEFAATYSRYEYFFRWCGFHDNHLIQASGESATGDVVASAKVMKLAEETAKRTVA